MGIQFEIDMSDLKRAGDWLKNLGAEGLKASERIAEKSAMFALAEIKRETPKHGTGGTSGSWQADKLSGGSFIVGSPSKVAVFLEEGTKPHDIVPRKGKALMFAWKLAGANMSQATRSTGRLRVGANPGNTPGIVFFRRVHHPGTKPLHIVEQASVKTGDFMERTADAEITRIIEAKI